jgi:hypothetical protein
MGVPVRSVRSGECAPGGAVPELSCDYTVLRDRKSAPAELPVITVTGGS